MPQYFETAEYEARLQLLMEAMHQEKLDAMLLFAQESMYWLSGFDTTGFCFFQCLIVKADGDLALFVRPADLRQARQTSNVERVVVWTDRTNADPTGELKTLLDDMDLLGKRIGVEYDTHGMTGANCRMLDLRLQTFANPVDASPLVSRLRLVKSDAEIAAIRRAAELGDDALDAALPLVKAGADEADILAAMQATVLAGGGDVPATPFVIGSGRKALLCHYAAGRRTLEENDQLTLEWAGVEAHYHSVAMRTVLLGEPSERHLALDAAARETLEEIEAVLRPGNTFGDVFAAYAEVMAAHDLTRHRLNTCGYSVGARFAPTWIERQMFFAENAEPIQKNMTLFVHGMILDSDSGTAMTLGRTYLTTDEAPEPLTRFGLDLVTC
ncbi:M24 family metallopeptidase [Pararhizobium mangrovi]|uniref:Aminopeptidase P family protein n=1 Tax=Pararhizobium mangrovi TaxID=2590452 RepID=A0A506UC42_9HYPH|nr:Xaa-Pro peptidase family protein [Pararhizobium mangrovi]TPW30395.1 aminopeptidase P family protein [Pararhizobium mangrovi]